MNRPWSLTADRTLLVIAHRLETTADGRYAACWAQRTRAAGWRLTPAA